MQVVTDRFGELDVASDRVLRFPDGLPGFPDAHQFALVDVPDSDVFFWLQSLEDPSLAFLAVVPWPFFPDYEPELPESDREILELEAAEDALVLCLVTVLRDEGSICANLLGPVIVNQATHMGRQVILTDTDFPVRAPLPRG